MYLILYFFLSKLLIFLEDKKVFFLFDVMGVMPECMCTWCPLRSEEIIESPRFWVTDGEPQCGCTTQILWQSNK